jgi:hypothetical protein
MELFPSAKNINHSGKNGPPSLSRRLIAIFCPNKMPESEKLIWSENI